MEKILFERMYHEQIFVSEMPMDFHIHTGAYADEHTHGYWEIMLVTDNECTNYINGEPRILKKYEVQILRPDDLHKILKSGDLIHTHINIEIKPEVFEEIISSCYCAEFYREMLGKARLGSLVLEEYDLDYVKKLLHRVQLCGNELEKWERYLRQIVCHIVLKALDQKNSLFMQSSDEPDENISKSALAVKRAMSLMRRKENFGKNITEICEMLGISERHLGRLFDEQGKETPGREFRNIKLDYACGLLMTTSMTISEVMEEVCILDFGHFNRIFHQKYGMSPGKIRTQKRRL